MIPNLNIDFFEGAPGAEPEINIRGFTSINEGEPMIVIDGVPSEPRDLTRLDPQDVENISVLKDASSSAIYGMATVDVYQRETTGMLTLGRELPSVLGADEPHENSADLETEGWELSLTYRDNFEATV